MIFLLIILSLFSVQPLLSPGFFQMHDFQQVARLFELDRVLASGVFPVRWVPDLGFGYGYALFNFYPPFVYYLGEVFHLAGFGLIDSIKIVWGLALIASAVAMYLLSKEFFGRAGGLVSAAFYLYVPYHAVDAYVRGSLAELFSFVWLPLILLAVCKKRPVFAGIFLALLMVTHNLVFLPFMAFFVVWALVFDRKSLIISPIIAFGLSAFFWLPSLAEKHFTLVDQFLTTGLANYKMHFVCPDQLWNSAWGYGGSIAGCIDGMSFKLGKPHIVLAILALVIALRKKSRVLLISGLLFAVSVFMTTPYLQFVWDRVSLLWYLQFPWRFLEFAALFSALLAGAFVLFLRPFRWPVALILVAVVIFLHGKYFQPQTYLSGATDDQLTTDREIKWVVSQTSFEYMPSGIAVRQNPNGSYILDIADYPREKYKVISGNFQEKFSNFSANSFELLGYSPAGSVIQFQITDFPGWQISPAFRSDNRLKLITVDFPAGENRVAGKFGNTPVRTAGNTISLVSGAGLVVMYAYGRRRHKA